MDDLRNARIALEATGARLRSRAPARATMRSTCMKELGLHSSPHRRHGREDREARRRHRGAHLRHRPQRRGAVHADSSVSAPARRSARSRPHGSSKSLPATDAAVRAGQLSSRQADLIASTASDDPSVERSLLEGRDKGGMALRDKCIEVRAAREDQAERSKRQRAARSFTMWPTPDGMVEGPLQGHARSRWSHQGRDRRRHAPEVPRGPIGWRPGAPGRLRRDAFADRMLGDPADAKSVAWTRPHPHRPRSAPARARAPRRDLRDPRCRTGERRMGSVRCWARRS